ncbi:MAG: hypothetical protein AB7H80_13940 [Candidatus Kapaibacterium sp.]
MFAQEAESYRAAPEGSFDVWPWGKPLGCAPRITFTLRIFRPEGAAVPDDLASLLVHSAPPGRENFIASLPGTLSPATHRLPLRGR